MAEHEPEMGLEGIVCVCVGGGQNNSEGFLRKEFVRKVVSDWAQETVSRILIAKPETF